MKARGLLLLLLTLLGPGCTSTYRIPFADIGRFTRNEPIAVTDEREVRLGEVTAVSLPLASPEDDVQVWSLEHRTGTWQLDDEAALSVKRPFIVLNPEGALIRGQSRQMLVPNDTLEGGLDVLVENRGARAGKIAGGVIGAVVGVALIVTVAVMVSKADQSSMAGFSVAP